MARVLLLGSLLAVAACGGPTAAPDGGGGPSSDRASALIDGASSSVDAAPLPPLDERLRIVNRCAEPLWIAQSANVPGPLIVPLAPGAHHDYPIPDGGLASARFWPKLGCDADGH